MKKATNNTVLANMLTGRADADSELEGWGGGGRIRLRTQELSALKAEPHRYRLTRLSGDRNERHQRRVLRLRCTCV